MKKYFSVPCDLYVSKDDIKRMERGHLGTGHKKVMKGEKHRYELISKHAFQPITKQDVLNDNTIKVVFIFK